MAISHLRLVPTPPRPALDAPPDDPVLAAYARELEYIHRTLRRLGVAASEVEDLAHELFLVLRRSWAEYDATRPLRPFLFGIAFRIAAAHQRRRSREITFAFIELEDGGAAPDGLLERKQARALVLAALNQIPLERRAVLVMHDLDGVAMRDAATVLRVPLFTAYSRLRKARKELEATLRELVQEIAT